MSRSDRSQSLRLPRPQHCHVRIEIYSDASVLIHEPDADAVSLTGKEFHAVIRAWEKLGHRDVLAGLAMQPAANNNGRTTKGRV